MWIFQESTCCNVSPECCIYLTWCCTMFCQIVKKKKCCNVAASDAAPYILLAEFPHGSSEASWLRSWDIVFISTSRCTKMLQGELAGFNLYDYFNYLNLQIRYTSSTKNVLCSQIEYFFYWCCQQYVWCFLLQFKKCVVPCTPLINYPPSTYYLHTWIECNLYN